MNFVIGNFNNFLMFGKYNIKLYLSYYSKKGVEDVQLNKKICILDIDVQGVKQIKTTNLNPRLVFVKPPDLADLKKRLLGRGTETEESLKLRLAVAQQEIEYGKTVKKTFCNFF